MLGVLDAAEMPSFLGALDCLVLPSLNSTESFGLVQVEAMLCGTPAVASDLPGVRVPVRETGMGEVAARGDAGALAEAVTRILMAPARYARPRADIVSRFDPAETVAGYEAVFERCITARRQGARRRPAG
jgi:glycosyltransferase involved in cell wall biosynthesis